MTFLDWCLEGLEIDDNYYMQIQVHKPDGSVRKVYKPGVEVRRYEIECLKPLEIIGEPEFKDDIWYVDLQEV